MARLLAQRLSEMWPRGASDDHRRLAIVQDGKVSLYDSGDHCIEGVSQNGSRGEPFAFTSQKGELTLD